MVCLLICSSTLQSGAATVGQIIVATWKNIMTARIYRPDHRFFAALTLMIFSALCLPAMAEETVRRSITMTGTGEVNGAPDKATISSGVVSESRTASEALAQNNEAMARALQRLKSFGIADRDLQTSNFSISPRYYHDPKGKQAPRIVGYTVSNQLTVIIRDLTLLGEVLDEVVSQGANQVSGPNFGIENPKSLRDIARKRATDDALRKAKIYTEGLNVSLGNVISITESGGYQPQPMPIHARAMAMEASVPIEAGELGLSVSVNITWEIK